MTNLEIIDNLCMVTTQLSDIVRKQAIVIEQSDIADAVKEELRQLRNETDDQLDLIEYGCRRLIKERGE